MSWLERTGGAVGGPDLPRTWLRWLNGADQSHWTPRWQWVKVRWHGTEFPGTTVLSTASWQTEAAVPLAFLGLTKQMAVARTEAASPPPLPSPHLSRDKWWSRLACGSCGEEWCGWRFSLCQPVLGWIIHNQADLAWPSPAWPGLSLDPWGVVMESGLGTSQQRRPQTAVQYGNMSEVCLAPFQSEFVWVCVPGGSANSGFGGIQRWDSWGWPCWDAQKGELEGSVTYILHSTACIRHLKALCVC